MKKPLKTTTTATSTAQADQHADGISKMLPEDYNLDMPKTAAMPEVPKGMPTIPVTQGRVGAVTGLVVDGVSLHQALGVKRHFATWITARIEDYEFTQGKDFEISDYPKLGNQFADSRGGDRKSKKYTLTLEMAKELAMLEKNDMGRAVRKYFIQCERNLLASAQAEQPQPQVRESVKDPLSAKLLDANGKEFGGNPAQRHAMLLIWLFAEIPRKKAYEEYARTLGIVGLENKHIAEKVAECFYLKTFQEKSKGYLTGSVSVMDLSQLKALIEKEMEK